jgi:hypothetical protein
MSAKLDKRNQPIKCDTTTPSVTAADITSASVLVDGHAVYATADQNGALMVLYASTAEYVASGKLSDLNQWHEAKIKSRLPDSMSGDFLVDGAISTMALDGYGYIFWKSTDGVFRVLRISFAEKPTGHLATIGFDNIAGISNGVFASNIAAFGMPGGMGKKLDGRIGCVVLYKDASACTSLLGVTLDPSTFVPNGPWQVEDHSGGMWAALDADGSLASGGYTHLTAAWINQGAMQLTPYDVMRPYITLVTCLRSRHASNPSRSYGLPLAGAFDPISYMKVESVYPPIHGIEITGLQEAGVTSAATLCTAPDGSVLAKFSDASAHARTASLLLNSRPSGDPDHGKPGMYSPCWIVASGDPDGHSPSVSSQTAPCSLFLPLPIQVGRSPCPVPMPSSTTTTYYENCRIQKHVECVLTAASQLPMFSTFYWGEIFAVPDYITADLLDEYKQTLILSMVADSFPYPVPEKRVWGADSPSGMINWLLCTYEYLVGSDASTKVENNITGAAGFKFSDTLLITSVGVQTEISLSVGYASITSTERTIHIATACSVTTKGLPKELQETPEQTDDAELFISPEGALFCNTPISRIGFDLAVTLLRGSNAISGSMVVKAHPIMTSPPTAIAADYATYCYTPGDLTSYQEQRINSTMYDLFGKLSEQQQAEFIINGEDFRSFYTGRDYLNKVIDRFGSPSFGPGRDSNYLEFSFSETSIMRDEYQDTSNFTHAGRWFIDSSIYAGVASHIDEEAEVGILGIIGLGIPMLEETISFMVGMDISASHETSSSSSASWGISLGEYLNPLAPGEAYTARMYFLKPSPLWAVELKHFGFPSPGYESLPNIDLVNSAPVRVLFTVPYVSEALQKRTP